MAFEKLFDASNATPFKFDKKGAVLEGYYMGSFDFTGDYGPTKKHIFQTANGAEVVFGQRNLMQQLPSATVGAMIRITYTGDKVSDKKGRQPMKLFQIEQDKKNTVEVVGVDLTPTEDNLNNDVDDSEDEETAADEVALPRTQAPRQVAAAPDADRQRKVQELLNRGRNKTA